MSILNKDKIFEQARLFVEESRFDKAIKEYEKIALADPQDMRVKLRIADLHVKLKRVGDAIRVYREVAHAYTQQGFYLKAVTVYKNILRLNPSLIEINGRLAELYEQMGLHRDAVRQYEIYSGALENKGEYELLMDVRKKVVELMPEDGGARIRYAELLQREGKNEEAIDQYEQYARRLEQSSGNEARLVEMYEKVLSYRSDRNDMLRSLIRIYYRNGETKKALKWLEFAKSLTTVDVELLEMQASIYVRLNQIETARAKMLTLSDLYREQGDTVHAAGVLARIASVIPTEEDRARRRAAEIGADAVQVFDAELERLRRVSQEELEVEERAREQEEAPRTAPAPKRDDVSAQEHDLDRTIIVPIQKAEPPKIKPEKARPTTTQVRQSPEAASAVSTEAVSADQHLREAKAAYDLGKFYEQLGLKDEARRELSRALECYKHIEELPDVSERMREIAGKLGSRKPAMNDTKEPVEASVTPKSSADTRSVKQPPAKNKMR